MGISGASVLQAFDDSILDNWKSVLPMSDDNAQAFLLGMKIGAEGFEYLNYHRLTTGAASSFNSLSDIFNNRKKLMNYDYLVEKFIESKV